MPGYDADLWEQPAPVAYVDPFNPTTGVVAADTRMLLDTGADVSLVPRSVLSTLDIGESDSGRSFLASGFDSNESESPAVFLRMRLLNKDFTGLFLLSDADYGIIGRNILKNLRLIFDGPRQVWEEVR